MRSSCSWPPPFFLRGAPSGTKTLDARLLFRQSNRLSSVAVETIHEKGPAGEGGA